MTPEQLLRGLGRAARSMRRDLRHVRAAWEKAVALVEADPEDLAGTRALTATMDLLTACWERWRGDGLTLTVLLAVEPGLADLVRWVRGKAQEVREFEAEHYRDLVPEQRKLIAAVRRAAAILS